MLPSPFELERRKLGRESMYNQLHDPRSIVLRLPSSLRYLAIVLPLEGQSASHVSWLYLTVYTGCAWAGWACFQYMSCVRVSMEIYTFR